MILLHAGMMGRPTLCGLTPGLQYTVVKSQHLTNCKNCITSIRGKSLEWTFDGFVKLDSGVFVERGVTKVGDAYWATTELVEELKKDPRWVPNE